jgi:hypothetical protein
LGQIIENESDGGLFIEGGNNNRRYGCRSMEITHLTGIADGLFY